MYAIYVIYVYMYIYIYAQSWVVQSLLLKWETAVCTNLGWPTKGYIPPGWDSHTQWLPRGLPLRTPKKVAVNHRSGNMWLPLQIKWTNHPHTTNRTTEHELLVPSWIFGCRDCRGALSKSFNENGGFHFHLSFPFFENTLPKCGFQLCRNGLDKWFSSLMGNFSFSGFAPKNREYRINMNKPCTYEDNDDQPWYRFWGYDVTTSVVSQHRRGATLSGCEKRGRGSANQPTTLVLPSHNQKKPVLLILKKLRIFQPVRTYKKHRSVSGVKKHIKKQVSLDHRNLMGFN